MRTYKLKEAMTPGGRWLPVRVVDPDYSYYEKETGVNYTIPCFDTSGLDFVAECVREPILHKRNSPVLLTGDPGLGKSTVILSLGKRINPSFSLDDVTFTLDSFEDRYRTLSYGNAALSHFSQIDADETAHAMYGPEYLDEEQRTIAKNLIVSRIKQLIVYFAAPRWGLINPHVRGLMTTWIHVFEPLPYLQGLAILKTAPPGRQSEYAKTKFWEPYCAFLFPPLRGPFWNEYEQKKIAFVDTCLQSKAQQGKYGSIMAQIARNLRQRGLDQIEIAKIMQRDPSRISRYLKSDSPN